MSLRSRRFPRLLLPVIAVMCLSAAPPQQLNPTVTVLAGAATPVPPECEEGLAPQPQPRVTAEEKAIAQQIAAPPVMEAPPTKDLRSTLAEVQTAAERNDRTGFLDALGRVKALLSAYPLGGERTVAEKAVAVYDDLDRVWTYQLTPAGAFFDSSSDLFKTVSQYPGYDTFIGPQILTDRSGTKFYPSSESRAFLTQLAAVRVKDLGISTAAAPKSTTVTAPVTRPAEKIATAPVVAPTERSAAPEKPATEHQVGAAKEKPKRATTASQKHHEAVRSTATKAPATRKPPSGAATEPAPKRAATVGKSVTPEKTKTAASAARKESAAAVPTGSMAAKGAVAATSTPAAAPATNTAAAPPSVSQATSTTTTPAAPSAPATATTATTASEVPATDTSVAQTSTAPGQENKPGKPNEPRNLLMPIILIVVGVGVLILLFRTSPGGK